MSHSRDRGSIVLSEPGRKRLKQFMHNLGFTITSLSAESEIGETQIKNAMSGKAVDKSTLRKLCQTLRLEVLDLINAKDWQTYCHQRISQHLELTTLPIISREGIELDWPDCRIDMFLEQRKSPLPRKRTSFQLHQGSDLFDLAAAEVEQRYSFAEFSQKIFGNADTQPLSQRVAIVGAVGAGKTSCLQQLVQWLLAHPSIDLVIWIPVVQLQDLTIEQYLQTQWLAGEKVSQLDWDELMEQIAQGRAWFFLDAVDEAGGNSISILKRLNVQLTGWLDRANVVLSCRNNVWDLESNPLRSRFEVYCIKPLQYGSSSQADQVSEFIQARFKKRPKLGTSLRKRLEQPVNRSLRDLVRNPLCLELLCYLWWVWHRERPIWARWNRLPQSRFELYQTYARHFFDTWRPQLKEPVELSLNPILRAIQVLAFRALTEEVSPFRLRYSFLLEVWRSEGFDPHWLQQLKQMAVLNLVGRAKENPAEDVYAFVHPVFQEFFAAEAVPRGQILFNPYKEPESYLALEPHLREVVLLYLERNVPSQDKEALLQELANFDDLFSGYFALRARLLAAAGVNCYENFTQKEKLIEQVARWSCGLVESSTYPTLAPQDVEKLAAQALLETDSRQAVLCLRKMLDAVSKQDVKLRLKILDRLIQLQGGRAIALREIRRLWRSQSLATQLEVVPTVYKLLQSYELDDPTSIDQLLEPLISYIRNGDSPTLRLETVLILRKIDPMHPEILIALQQIQQTGGDSAAQKLAGILYDWMTRMKPELEHLLYGEDGWYRQYSLKEIDALLEESSAQLRSDLFIESELLTRLALAIKVDENFKFTFQGERLLRLFSVFKQLIYNCTFSYQDNEVRAATTSAICHQVFNICSEQLPYLEVCSAWLNCE